MGQHNSNFELASEARRAAERCESGAEPRELALGLTLCPRLTCCVVGFSLFSLCGRVFSLPWSVPKAGNENAPLLQYVSYWKRAFLPPIRGV